MITRFRLFIAALGLSLACVGALPGASSALSITKTVNPTSGLLVGDVVNICLDVSSPPPQADILWVIDVSSSMNVGINNIVANILTFTAQLSTQGISYRNGLFIYTGDSSSLLYLNYGWAANDTVFANNLNNAASLVYGGIEWSLEALLFSRNINGWRAGATKTMVLITDEGIPCSERSYVYPFGYGPALNSISGTAAVLQSESITVHSISSPWPWDTDPEHRCDPQDIPPANGGLWLDYNTPAPGWTSLLNQMAAAIVGNANMVVRDPLPAGLAPVPGTLGSGVQVGNEVRWTVSSAAQGSSLQFCFDAVVTAPWPGAITNTGKVSADNIPEQDSNPVPLFYSTPTITPTYTFTPTPSITPTDSSTYTVSPTNTPTPTSTSTPSATSTRTPTRTSTPTPSFTFTATPTFSSTPTPTYTATPTDTSTRTPTYTHSPTSTSTSTATPSSTQTWTHTDTPTRTATPTQSSTATQTWSFTQTPTRTATPTDSFTRTASPTFSHTATRSATPTISPSSTPTSTRSGTPTRTVTPTQSATRTQTPTATASPSDTPTRTITVTFTATPTWSASPTASPTHVPMPFRLVLGVYNSAGERVKQLYDGGVSVWPGSSVLEPDALGDVDSVAQLRFLSGGQLPDGSTAIFWNGDNDQGQPVSSGTYWFKLEIHHSEDTVTALTKGILVIRPDRGLSLAVFNGAGELVAELPVPADADPASFRLVEMAGGSARIDYESPSGPGRIFWNGLGRDGLPVANGSYLIRSQGQGSSRSFAFTLLRGPVNGGRLLLAPNPADRSVTHLWLDFDVPLGATAAHAELYNLAGERVRRNEGPAAVGRLSLDVNGLASGIYVVVLDLNGPNGYRQMGKAALVR